MKKIILLTLCLWLAALSVTAQDKKGDKYISFHLGPSLPSGDLSNNVSSRYIMGFAGTGIQLSGTYQYFIHPRFSLFAQLRGQWLPIKKSALTSDFGTKKYYGVVFTDSISYPPMPPSNYTTYNHWHFNSAGYLVTSAMLGAEGNTLLSQDNQWLFNYNCLIGITYIRTPHFKGSSVTDTSYAVTEQKSVGAFGFAYQAGIGIKHVLNKKMYVQLQGNYTGPIGLTFKSVKQNSVSAMHPGEVTGTMTSSYSLTDLPQKPASWNIGIGVGFRIL